MDKAIAAGLYHGSLSLDAISVDAAGHLRIDFLSRFYASAAFNAQPDEDTDRKSTLAVVQQLLSPVVHAPQLDSLLNGQQRGQLRSLLSQSTNEGDLWERMDRWVQLLVPFRKVTGSETLASEVQGVPSQPLAVEQTCVEQVEAVLGKLEQLDAGDDLTGEMEITPIGFRRPGERPEIGSSLGRFQLQQVLGEGGMGVVFRAVDLSNDQCVAIKVLRSDGQNLPQAIRRFQKEARLLAKVQNAHVTQLLHCGFERGHHYLAMEYVDGTNLKQWVQSHGPLSEAQALHVIGDIARALADAHRQDVIHRDIKPENILLGKVRKEQIDFDEANILSYQVKLSDFGIARTLNQSASMEMTRAGAMLGTPTYMSPEQCKGAAELTPAADIYALGVTLYLLLTGHPPFESDDLMKLTAMHCFEPPLNVQRRNPAVSDATAALVQQMLAKNPSERPADAAQLVREVERLLSGETSDFELHPRPRGNGSGQLWQQVFRWELASDAAALWPLVSNTERLNRAAGLPSVTYRTHKDADGVLRKIGSFRLAGMEIEWEEHPFEWIEGRRMGVLREFTRGPFEWFKSTVELSPRDEGGTTLVHTVQIQTRNALGRIVANIEAGWKGGRALDRIYRRIDKSLQFERHNALHDPFETPDKLDRSAEQRLEQRVERLLQMGVDYELADKLVEYLRSASAQSLAQIRPLHLAEQLNVAADRWIDTCLFAAHVGLLQLRWDILCPTCRAAASTAQLLSQIHQHTECVACDYEFQSNAANAIELVFQVHPEIRAFDDGQYCIGGPEHSPHVVSQVRMEQGERLELALPLSAGDYLLRVTRSTRSQPVRARSFSAASHFDLRLSQLGTLVQAPVVRAGKLTLALTNDLATTQVVRMERAIDRTHVVTAATASALPRFRSLFPDQVFSRTNAVSAEDMTLLATRLIGCDQIYASHNDAEAYALIQQAMQLIENCVQANQGAVIKTVGELLIASFNDTVQAIRAAVDLSQRFKEALASQTSLTITSACHRGPLLVTNQNGRLDYFGTTARQVQSLCNQLEGGLALTDSVFADPAVTACLEALSKTGETRSGREFNLNDHLIQHIRL